jgi:type IV pilus assembly protein PilY1
MRRLMPLLLWLGAGIAQALVVSDLPVLPAAGAGVSSARVGPDTLVFTTSYSSADWSGDVVARLLQANGATGETRWDAAARLDAEGAAARSIWTLRAGADPGARGVPFQWDALSGSEQALLNRSDKLGAQRLDYLRGARTDEAPNGAKFRARTTLLGDIVDSAPLVVGKSDYGFGAPGFPDPGYAEFRASAAYRARPDMVYVGANDGMLHGFDAASGDERFAYVPAGVFARLSALTSPDYKDHHQFSVDGSARAIDAWIGGSWRTVLVGATGAGGRAVFALDVSQPDAFGAAGVLWELSSTDDADFGVSVPLPSVGRLHDGHWAAILANGYDSRAGTAKLFIVDLATGTVLRKIDTGVTGDNGLSSPIAVDLDGDRVIDAVYAGDLKGNLWKFDLSAPDPARWELAFHSQPLFQACASAVPSCAPADLQPITARPEVAPRADGGVMVYVGTGRALAAGDAALQAPLNSVYGVRDGGAPLGVARVGLQAQAIVSDGNVRRVSANRPGSDQNGWVLDLPAPGERVLSAPVVSDGRVLVRTQVPGAGGWLLAVDAASGGRLAYPVMDSNGDGRVDRADASASVPASGVALPEGAAAGVTLLRSGDSEFIYTGASSAPLATHDPALGRRSWRELR